MSGELWPTDCGNSDFTILMGFFFFFLLVSVACSALTFQRWPQWSAISLFKRKRWEENSGPKFLRPPVQLICHSGWWITLFPLGWWWAGGKKGYFTLPPPDGIQQKLCPASGYLPAPLVLNHNIWLVPYQQTWTGDTYETVCKLMTAPLHHYTVWFLFPGLFKLSYIQILCMPACVTCIKWNLD